MTFKVAPFINLLALASLLSTVLTVFAQDIAFYGSANCKGGYVFCSGRGADACCSSSNGWTSYTVWQNGGYLNSPAKRFLGYSRENCQGGPSTGSPGTCVRGSGPYFSAKWTRSEGNGSGPGRRETNFTTSITEARGGATNCATPDTYGFTENGTEVTFPIPRGSKEAETALYELLADESTDAVALRKFASANRLEAVTV